MTGDGLNNPPTRKPSRSSPGRPVHTPPRLPELVPISGDRLTRPCRGDGSGPPSLRVLSGAACVFPGFRATRVSRRLLKVTTTGIRRKKKKKKPASKGDVIPCCIFIVYRQSFFLRHRFSLASSKWRRLSYRLITYTLFLFLPLGVASA